MKNYESPVILDNEEMAEGVYATGSGGSSESSFISHTDWKKRGNTDTWDIKIDATYYGTVSTESVELVINFDTTVTYVSCSDGGSLESGDTGTVLRIKCDTHFDQASTKTFTVVVTSPIFFNAKTLINCK